MASCSLGRHASKARNLRPSRLDRVRISRTQSCTHARTQARRHAGTQALDASSAKKYLPLARLAGKLAPLDR